MSLLGPIDVSYARTVDDMYIAYQAFGSGPPILYIGDGFVPIDLMSDEPGLANAMRQLSSFGRVVRFDRRGVGASDPVTPTNPPTLEQWVEDAIAVFETEDLTDAWVLAPADGALVALTMAAVHPKRVRGLILINAFARASASDDHVIGFDHAVLDSWRNSAILPDGPEDGFDLLGLIAPSVAHDVDFRRWWDRAGRRGASPATAAAFRRVIDHSDVRSVLETIDAPTLVLHRTGARFSPVEQGRYLARTIRSAELVELDGDDTLWWVHGQDELLDRIEGFVTGAASAQRARRPYLTVMVTDIVDSTGIASQLGDTEWSRLLERYLKRGAVEVVRERGHYVKDTGDGILAVFEGPARAVRCARAMRDFGRTLGFETRTGVHAGEVELRGLHVGGITVHLTSRLEGFARAGEIIVSRRIFDLTRGANLAFEDRGTHEFRGVDGEWQVFALVP